MIDLGSIQLKDIRIGTQQVKKAYLGPIQVYPQAGTPVVSDVALNQFLYPDISYQGGTYNPIIDITYTLTYPNGDTSEEHGLPPGYRLYYWITWAGPVTGFVTVDSYTGVLSVQPNSEFSTRSFYVHVQLNGPSGNVSSATVTLTQQAKPRQNITLTLGYTIAGWVSVTASQAVVDSLTIIVQLYDPGSGAGKDVTLNIGVGGTYAEQPATAGYQASIFSVNGDESSPYSGVNADYTWTNNLITLQL
jgi:hypothetical protein